MNEEKHSLRRDPASFFGHRRRILIENIEHLGQEILKKRDKKKHLRLFNGV